MHHYSVADQIHILLALMIAASYMAVPFTALRRLPLPPVASWAGTFFFLTCAITHIAIAVGFHDNQWMLANDLVQVISTVVFVVSLSRMVAVVMNRRDERIKNTGA